ncbi:MAG TPA: hypothetical protein VKZ79_20755 [Alphaproteobacteria bacterium]|nr:hypothetical protein [Alphaproteobacteria bacterium]
MVDDLRAAASQEYWARFEAMMGSDGLLTYRYLGRRTVALHDVDHDSMRIRRDMRNAVGGLTAAPLAIATAESGGFTDIESIPAPVTAALHILDDGRDVREVLIRRTFVHMGKTMGFTQSEVMDAANPSRLIAIAHGTGVKLADAPAGFRPVEPGPDIEDDPALPPLHAVFGGKRRAEGVWELPPLNPRNASTSASLHIGPIHVVLETAAMELAAREAGTRALQMEDWNVSFVARGTHGPFVAEGAGTAAGLGRVAVRLALRDEGRQGRVIASAVAIFRPAP